MQAPNEESKSRPQEALIVGLGLLGGSLGLALRAAGWRVRALVRRPEHARAAVASGVADEAGAAPAEVARDAGLAVLCLPLSALEPVYRDLAGFLARQAVVTDVGSVKAPVVPRLDAIARTHGHRFVGAHPMAGAEKTGMDWARADLYQDAGVALCPGATADGEAVRQVTRVWEQAGAQCLVIGARLHDEIVSRTSHLPHLTAACLVHAALADTPGAEAALLSAGGFRDSTRIAAGPADMWTEILEENRAPVLSALRAMERELAAVARHLETDDRAGLHAYLAAARARRAEWQQRRGLTDPGPGERLAPDSAER